MVPEFKKTEVVRTEFRKELDNRRKTLLFIWAAILFMVLNIVWIPKFVSVNIPGLTIDAGTAFFRTTIWIVSAGAAIFLLWWKNSCLSKEAVLRRSQGTKLLNMVKGSETIQEEALGKAVSFYFYVHLLAFAISESIGLFGFVLASVGGFLWDQYVLTVISVLLLVFFYPSESFFASLIGVGTES